MTKTTKSADAPQLKTVAEMKAALSARTTGQRHDDLQFWRQSCRAVVNDEPLGIADAERLEDLMERRDWNWSDFENDCDVLRRCDANKDLLDEVAAAAKAAELAATANRLGEELQAATFRLAELRQASHEARCQSTNHTLSVGQLRQVVNLNRRLFANDDSAFGEQNLGASPKQAAAWLAGGQVGGYVR